MDKVVAWRPDWNFSLSEEQFNTIKDTLETYAFLKLTEKEDEAAAALNNLIFEVDEWLATASCEAMGLC